MMHIQAKTFNSTAEMIAAAKARRERLFPDKRVNKALMLRRMEREAAKQRRLNEERMAELPALPFTAGRGSGPRRLRREANVREFTDHDFQVIRICTRRIESEHALTVYHRQNIEAVTSNIDMVAVPLRQSVKEIEREILDKHDEITTDDIRSGIRSKAVAWVRHEIMWTIKERRPDLSLPQLGRMYCRDHTTCLNSIRQWQKRLDEQ